MRVDDPPCDRQADPEAVRFRRHEWREQRAVDLRRQTGSGVAHRDFDVGGTDVAAYREVTAGRRHLGHRVHGVDHEVHEHLLQEHRIADDDAGFQGHIHGGLDLPRAHVVSDEGQAGIDDGVKVDRFLDQLTTAQHRPVAIDDLRGLDDFRVDVGHDFAHRVGGGTIGRHHDLQRLGVVHEGRERLAELMPNRTRQRRHRLAATRVSGEGQVPPAVDLGPLPCAALEQEPDNQERLDDERGQHAQYGEAVFPPQAGRSIAHDAARRQPALGDAPPLQFAPVEHRWTCGLWWYPDLCGRFAIQESNGDVRRAATQGVHGHHRPANDARSEEHVDSRKQGRIRRGAKLGHHSLVRVRAALRVRVEAEVEDRRVGWQVRASAHDFARDRSSDQMNVRRP